MVDRLERNLELHEDQVRFTQSVLGGVDIGGQKVRIRTLDDQDRVFSGLFHEDGRNAGRFSSHFGDMARIDAVVGEVADRVVAEKVVAHFGDHADGGAEFCGRNRLVGPLAAAAALEAGRFQRFARLGHPVDIGDQINHVGADNGDASGLFG